MKINSSKDIHEILIVIAIDNIQAKVFFQAFQSTDISRKQSYSPVKLNIYSPEIRINLTAN